jgi:hypothetical protein
MPLSDARETGANALIPRVAGGRRASETTQCARHQSAAPPLGIGRAIGTVRSGDSLGSDPIMRRGSPGESRCDVRDGGQTLSAPRELATASRSADHPTLVVTRRGLRVSWFSADTGHQLLPVGEAGSDTGGL